MRKPTGIAEHRAFVEELPVATIALAVGWAIKSSGLRHSVIAKRMGVSYARVSQIVKGTGNPTVKTLARLADVLGYSLQIEFVHREAVNNRSQSKRRPSRS